LIRHFLSNITLTKQHLSVTLNSSLNRPSNSPIPCLIAVTLFSLVVLAWSSLTFSGEIHDAAETGDLAKVKALLNGNADLAFSKDNKGTTLGSA